MENEKLKRSVGRPQYVVDIEQLQELFKQVEDKTITNEQGWLLAKCKKTKWFELKRKYNKIEV